MRRTTRQAVLYGVLPMALIGLQKVNVDHNYERYGKWHEVVNYPFRVLFPHNQALASTPYYDLDTFGYLALVYFMAPLAFIGWGIRESPGMLRDFVWINAGIWSWFFLEFLLIYNMTSSIPKIMVMGVLILTSIVYRSVT